MCGIVGYIGEKRAQPVLLNCLSRLEYRGYDSCGIAVSSNGIEVHKDLVRAFTLTRSLWTSMPYRQTALKSIRTLSG